MSEDLKRPARFAPVRSAPGRGIAGLLAAALLAASTAAAPAEHVEDLLKRKTQEFSDAGLAGNRAVLDRDLAPDVSFVNENGTVSTKAEIVQGAIASPAAGRKLTVTEFNARVHGPVAVATFVDVLTYSTNGSSQVYRYLSTEVWRKDPAGWRIIASQTLTLADDPPSVTLPAETLAEYASDYRAGPGPLVRISGSADGIVSSAAGGAPVTLRPVLKDIFFLPAQPHLRRIFRRDPQGRVSGYVNRFEGHDTWTPRI